MISEIIIPVKNNIAHNILNGTQILLLLGSCPQDKKFIGHLYCEKDELNLWKHLYVNEYSVRAKYGNCNFWGQTDSEIKINTDSPYEFKTMLAEGNMVGNFVCRFVEVFSRDDILSKNKLLSKLSTLSNMRPADIVELAQGKEKIYGLYITALEIYEKPKPLYNFQEKCPDYGTEKCKGCNLYMLSDSDEPQKKDTYECFYGGYKPIDEPTDEWRKYKN